jgi:nucleotide-binding universal stress UspA family protein
MRDGTRDEAMVVVGVDGSAGSDAAVDWAACTAVRLDRTLIVVSVEQPHVAAELVAAGRAAAHAARPGLRTQGCVAAGQPADQLRRLAAAGDLLVVGQHGLGAFGRSVIGSVALQLANYAPCPVVVARHRPGRGAAPVTVGVDGSARNDAALRFAFERANATGEDVRAVLAYDVGTDLPQHCRATATERLDAALAPYRKEFPMVVVRPDAIRGPASRAMIEASRWASLVVVGARGDGGFGELRLGSVAQHVLFLAGCPVAVVPAR